MVERRPGNGHVEVGSSERKDDVREGRLSTAERKPLLREPVADAVWPDRDPASLPPHHGATTECQADHVRHPKVGPHATDVDYKRRLAREAADQYSYVGGGAADIHHQPVHHAGQVGAPSHAVSRARGEHQARVAARIVKRHQRSVVLSEVARLDVTGRPDGGLKRGGGQPRDFGEGGVENGCVLALEKADRPDHRRDGNRMVDAGLFGTNLRCAPLVFGIDG